MEAKQTPLIELLERVPQNARCRVDEPDGMGSVFIPVGKLCHEAAAALRAALAEPVKAEMTRRDIIRMAKEADDLTDAELGSEWNPDRENLRDIHFAALVAAEKEQQMIRDGWRQCAKGQRMTQYCGLLDAAVKAEREACAVVCEKLPETFKIAADEFGYQAEMPTAENCAAAIRARGEA